MCCSDGSDDEEGSLTAYVKCSLGVNVRRYGMSCGVTLVKSGRCGDVNVVVEHHWSAKTAETYNLEFTVLTLDIETSLYRVPFSK
jgi:hypothetical protein